MAIEDLDLEFEDDEEVEKSDALDVDIDLSFSVGGQPNKASGAPQGGRATNVSAHSQTNPNLKLPPKAQAPSGQQVKRTPQPTQKPTQTPSKTVASSTQQARSQAPPGGQVRNIAEARKASTQTNIQQRQVTQEVPFDQEDISYEINLLRDEIKELKAQMNAIQHDADVKVAVANAKAEFVIDYVTDAKLVDHQVNQVLQRIHKKVPGLKSEVLTIKKFMTEFLEKTTKKK